MSEAYRKNKHTGASIITSPDGVRIQITAGNKLKFNTALQNVSTAELGDIQRRIYSRLIDKTNEGFGNDPGRYGYAYPSFETLAEECGCTKRAVQENVTALETGVTRKGRPIPERWRIKVKRRAEKGKGGAGNVNLYWLPLWNEFGAVENGEFEVGNGEPSTTVETVNLARETVNPKPETANPTHGNGEPGSPDSSSNSASKLPFRDTHGDRAHAYRDGGCSGHDLSDDEADEIDVPENYKQMSLKGMFEFLKSAYGNSRPEDSEGEWCIFEEVVEAKHLYWGSAVEGINQDRGDGRTFLEFLKTYIWEDGHNWLDKKKSRWEEDQERKARAVHFDDEPF